MGQIADILDVVVGLVLARSLLARVPRVDALKNTQFPGAQKVGTDVNIQRGVVSTTNPLRELLHT